MESIVADYWRKFEWFVTRIESIIWSIFTVKVIDYRFRFLLVVKLQRNLNLCFSHHSSRGKGAGFSQA